MFSVLHGTNSSVGHQWKHLATDIRYVIFIPHATSCGGYNVFDPSISQSISPVFLVSATPLKPLNRISWNFVVVKDIPCRCAYLQEILIHFFSRNYALFELRNLTKIKDNTKTVCQRNSSEAAQQNFVKLCSFKDVHIHRKFWFIFSWE